MTSRTYTFKLIVNIQIIIITMRIVKFAFRTTNPLMSRVKPYYPRLGLGLLSMRIEVESNFN